MMAGRRVRDLQARMMRVQSKARRVTRQVERMSKMLETQKKMELNNLTMQQQAANSIMPSIAETMATNNCNGYKSSMSTMMQGGYDVNTLQTMAQNNKIQINAQDQAWMAAYNSNKTSMSAMSEMMLTQAKNEIEERYENMNDIMLEPLKMEEDSLQTEKDSLESQLQIAQADYEACKKMEQSDAKNLAPNYTGQAG